MPVYEVRVQHGTHAETVVIVADAVRTDHGDLTLTRKGLASHLFAARNWTSCHVRDESDS